MTGNTCSLYETFQGSGVEGSVDYVETGRANLVETRSDKPQQLNPLLRVLACVIACAVDNDSNPPLLATDTRVQSSRSELTCR